MNFIKYSFDYSFFILRCHFTAHDYRRWCCNWMIFKIDSSANHAFLQMDIFKLQYD